jgi:hypothetical protein
MAVERRRAERLAFRDGYLPPKARVRPGCEVVVVNLSSAGALVEGPFRFKPGSRCEVTLGLEGAETLVRAAIVRCFVARLEKLAPVRYRAALNFECSVKVPKQLSALDGYPLPAAEPSRRGRGVGTTPTTAEHVPGETVSRSFVDEIRRH